MPVEYALTRLYDDVLARFTAEGTPAVNTFGWRAPAQHGLTPGNRIAWTPGAEDGDMGEMRPARNPGRNPRPLATLAEVFRVEISCVDADALKREDERAQYIAARALFDAWVRAVDLAATGTYEILETKWVNTTKERRYGSAIRVLASVQAVIADEPVEVAELDTVARIAVQQLDVSEVQVTEPPVTDQQGDIIEGDDGEPITEGP